MTPEKKLVENQAAHILEGSKSFQALPEARQKKVLEDTQKVIGYIADTGLTEEMGLTSAARPQAQNTREMTDVDFMKGSGEALADIVNKVDFPEFVADLIKGVFNAVVDASIQQMEAYATLVENVSKSVDQYMKDNISEEQGRDYLVNQYPDFLEADLSEGRVRPKSDADSDNAPDFMQDLGIPFSFDEMDDEENEQVVVKAARRKIAMNRQQLLATMVMMGLNRIVVTDGKIQAGVQFNLNTKTLAKRHYDRQHSFEYNQDTNRKTKKLGFWFLKPKVTETTDSTVNITTNHNLETDNERSQDLKVKMTGNVDLRFKSDYFPLEKMTEILGVNQENIRQSANPELRKQSSVAQPPQIPPLPGQ